MSKLWLLYRLHRLGFRVRPEPAFVDALERRLFGEPAKLFVLRTLVPRLAGASCAVLLFLGSGSSWLAYSSDRILPQSPLYPLRVWMEDMELKATSDADRSSVERKLMSRRSQEAALAVQTGADFDQRYGQRLLEHANELMQRQLDDQRTEEASVYASSLDELMQTSEFEDDEPDMNRLAYEQASSLSDTLTIDEPGFQDPDIDALMQNEL